MSPTKVYSLLIIAMLGSALVATPTISNAKSSIQRGGGGQRGGNNGGGGGQRGGNNGGGNQNRGGSRPQPQPQPQQRPTSAPQVHARRETVRTPNYVPRPTPIVNRGGAPQRTSPLPGGPAQYRRQPVSNPGRVQQQRSFTKTPRGRVYDTGLQLRRGMNATASWQKHYFPKGHYHFPFYQPNYAKGRCFVSPFGFYFGVCVPFIDTSECHVYPPSVVFIDLPVYNGDDCSGFSDAADENLLNDPNLNQDEPGLANALDELSETFQGGNIDGLVSLIDPNTSISVFLRGHYKYSLAANDYVDLTRDAIQTTQTVSYNLQYVHQRAPGVVSVSGQQAYRDSNGRTQTMWVSYVLQDISGQWTLTQVGDAPGHYQKLAQ